MMNNKEVEIRIMSMIGENYRDTLTVWCQDCSTAPQCGGCTIPSHWGVPDLPDLTKQPSLFKRKTNDETTEGKTVPLIGKAVTNRALTELAEVAHTQDLYGLQKYGKPLDPLDGQYDWLKMAREEMADMLKYLQCEEIKRNHVIKEIKYITQAIPQETRFKIWRLLDMLKG